VLLALIHVILVLAGRGCFEALTIDKVKLRKVCECSIGEDHSMWGPDISQDMIRSTYPEESVVLLSQINVAVGALPYDTRIQSGRGYRVW